MASWMAHNAATTGSAANRTLEYHPIPIAQAYTAAHTVLRWVMPPEWFEREQRLWIPLAALLVALFGITLWSLARHQRLPQSARAALIFLGTYMALLLVSISLFDAHTPLGGRLFAPVLVVALALATLLAERALSALRDRTRGRRLLELFLALALAAHLYRGVAWALPARSDGLGFASRTWSESALIQEAADLPADQPIYSNGPELLLLYAERPAYWLPMPQDASAGRPNGHLAQEMARMEERLCQEGGALVYLRRITWRYYLPSEAELIERLGLIPVYEDADGAIYRCAKDAISP